MDGGQVTLYEYLTDVQGIPAQYRPDLDDYDSLATIIFELKKLDLLSFEAIREGLDNDEEYLRRMKLFKELNMADIMRSDSIIMPPDPDEGMIRAYYDENPDEFTDPAKVHIFEILLSDELKAKKLTSTLTGLPDFKSSASLLTERPGKRTKGGDMGYLEQKLYPEIFDAAYNSPIGSIGGPIFTNNQYSVFYVADKIQPQLKDFLGVKRAIYEKLSSNQNELTLQKWIDSRLKETEVSVDEDVLWASINMDKYAQPEPSGN
jgi:parvulin-like peptidyl-prolyl isomerase